MNTLKMLGCIILALLLIAVVIGVYIFIATFAWIIGILLMVATTAYCIRAYFKGRPRKT